MKHRYLPATEQDKKEMLAAIGVSSTDELFADIPDSVRYKQDYQIKQAKSETELTKELTKLAAKNRDAGTYASFLGAGVYDHYQPVIVDHVISRSEFYTAYTPYQPEISQGELQAIFEFQTMICELTGMDISNSSMYDGGTALAEAAMLASGHTKKKKIVVSASVHPESREVLKTYAKGQYIEVVEVPAVNGVTDLDALNEAVCDETAAVVVQYPNFFGRIEPLKEIEPIAHKGNSMFIVSSNPLALGLLTPPGAFFADIVVGDAQPFGIPAAYGGPHCGFFAVTKKLMRKMPGRLVGQTEDENGKNGVKEIARQNIQKANYAKQQAKRAGLSVVFDGPIFNEFVVKLEDTVKAVNKRLLDKGIIGGYDLGLSYPELTHHMLIAVTELRTKEEIDALIAELGDRHE
ncbi:aminomethyl-transferring glycine dehydrogenase subunit GcvPA [Bacillus atrophaeus]|uniref:aminomethyl-transferring glycine dehydrogenase subunit GcvPA n=1 Tax=Bacillus atrophaeus TaxID=1452 RepID=UPI00227E09DD|nr:aminomethyl-transferring glycine dehydrogenase subunit GcvPA [Bacillus atrophaeus]MCY8818354.1 aminomethyl-transferring glycine dehydrogenase subunit GcvPA [Bacillus atrophaeus]